MKKLFLFVFLLLILCSVIFAGFAKKTSLEEHRKDVLSTLYDAIEDAQEQGVYKCCIKPACIMCYLGENKWNYNKAGTCYCDDFIAKGEGPCPQCKKGLEEGQCSSAEKKESNTQKIVCEIDF